MTTDTQRPRPHDLVSFAGALAGLGALGALVAGNTPWAAACAAVALGAAVVARRTSRRHPGPMPYALRWLLFLPRWPLTVPRLRAILEPKPGERILEVGPGVGIYALPIAAALGANGTLEALDVQAEMLAALGRRTRAAGVTNLVATEGDAQRLPYADASFDAAYLVSVLGEVPDPSLALREVRRILKPDGRLVVGEMLVADPDAVRLPALCEAARRAGFILERRTGPRFGYFARFGVAADQDHDT